MIEIEHLTKTYGGRPAVDDLTVTVAPGRVTGFLGPNGAGKSTTLRVVLGLDAPTSGRALVLGRPYRELRRPLHLVGAVLDARAVHPGRSGRNHLRALASYNGIGAGRVEKVLEAAGIAQIAGKRVGGYSLGMTQRLGIAAAMLGDPRVLILDEPLNGLDLDGVRWVRQLLRELAGQGRTVLVSSHLLSEMQQTADQVVVLGRGRLLADLSLADLVSRVAPPQVVVRPADREARTRLVRAMVGAALPGQVDIDDGAGDGRLTVRGLSVAQVGDLAHRAGARLHLLEEEAMTLETAYLELTRGTAEHVSAEVTQ